MRSSATTVSDYLAELPTDRREILSVVRDRILQYLPTGYVEVMNWGIITYEVPLSVYPDTYNRKPLMYAALANQKNYMSLYLCGLYCLPEVNERFTSELKKRNQKLNMGKSCIRFKSMDDLPLDLIGEVIGAMRMEEYVEAVKGLRKK